MLPGVKSKSCTSSPPQEPSLFFFFGCARGMLKFQGQDLPCHSSTLSHCRILNPLHRNGTRQALSSVHSQGRQH